MGVTKAEFAALRGVSRAAVNKAIASGRISLEPDGSIDPERAMREWDANTDPSKQRGRHAPARKLSPEEKARRREELEARRLARLAERAEKFSPEERAAVREFDRAAEQAERAAPSAAAPGVAAPAAQGGAPGGIDINKARTAKTYYEAQLARKRLQEKEEELVQRVAAEKMVTALARRFRDALLGWPARVSAELAAELGVEARALEQALEGALWEFLAEQAEIKVRLGSGAGDGGN